MYQLMCLVFEPLIDKTNFNHLNTGPVCNTVQGMSVIQIPDVFLFKGQTTLANCKMEDQKLEVGYKNYILHYVSCIDVMVGTDKPLAGLIVVCRLGVDKGQVLRFGILDTPFVTLCTTQNK